MECKQAVQIVETLKESKKMVEELRKIHEEVSALNAANLEKEDQDGMTHDVLMQDSKWAGQEILILQSQYSRLNAAFLEQDNEKIIECLKESKRMAA